MNVLGCLLVLMPAPAGAAGTGAVEHVVEGHYAVPAKLQAGNFASLLGSLPELRRSDPAQAEKVESGLRAHTPAEADLLLSYLAGHASDPCKAWHVRTNQDLRNFPEYFAKTVWAAQSFERACASFAKRDFEGAARAFSASLLWDGRYNDAYLHRAAARLRSGDTAGAMNDYRDSRLVPVGEISWPEGRCACSKELPEALTQLRERHEKAAARKKAGMEQFLKGDKRAAEKRFGEALESDPGDAEAFLNRSAARSDLGSIESALEDLDKAANLAGTRTELLWNILQSRSQLRLKRGDTAGAHQDMERIVVEAPDSWPGKEKIARDFRSLKDVTRFGDHPAPRQ